MSPQEQFVINLKRTAEQCADDYISITAGFPEDAPDLIWEMAWSDLVGGVTEGVTGMCQRLAIDPVTAAAMLDAALTFCFARVDAVIATQDELVGGTLH